MRQPARVEEREGEPNRCHSHATEAGRVEGAILLATAAARLRMRAPPLLIAARTTGAAALGRTTARHHAHAGAPAAAAAALAAAEVSIAVHILAQQRDLPHPLASQLLHFQ